ncbi:two-component system VirA-like sensor kinase [Neorhizobium sp. P12A]|uniref:two-component system VirA-like sensor kinase n=1 Tax=Neorhizobium sp. P12A TaxID=2268027 RepID=UPI0011ED2580|nr:two-component system VirA-like sensor kinase [Neorhizobium sp. P12A]KAA0690245.1 two-component system VirA-like sensor kinase [Neorhizobium sp. P12A]
MDADKKHRFRRIIDGPWAIVGVILCAIFFALLAVGRGPDRKTLDAVIPALHAIERSDSALQRDVLQARDGLLNNYDPLVGSVVQLHEMLNRLRSLSTDTDDQQRLAVPLERLSLAIQQSETLVEQFKTTNAILRNSQSIFGKILSDLYKSREAERQNFPAAWDQLSHLMMQFQTYPDVDLSQHISTILQQTSSTNEAIEAKLEALAKHGHMVLATLPVVDDVVVAIQNSEVSARAQDLQNQYLADYSESTVRATWSRLFLGTIAIVLCLYILLLVNRLRLQTNRLARRLDFENTRNEIKTNFDSVSSSDWADAIQRSLRVLARYFDAKRYEMLFFNIETGEIEEKYENIPGDGRSDSLIPEFLADLRRHLANPKRNRFFCRSLQSQGELVFTRDAMSAGAIVQGEISERDAAMVIFEYAESRPKASADEVELMQSAIDALIQSIDRVRKRQERDTLEQRLKHAERLQAVGTLAAGIAHEFNNILGSMLGYGEMALQILRRPSTTRHYVQEIVAAGERARLIIDQILTLSRKRERTSQPFDVVEAVSSILPMLKVSLTDAFQITSRLVDKPAVILGNPIEIQQIVMNLCKNAAEASDETGRIEIEVASLELRSRRLLSHGVLSAGSYIRLAIADNGAGIPEAVLSHIFEPFFTTKSRSGGTGLGLAAVHGNVQALAGHINVESEVGRGTRFDLYFPASLQPAVPLRQFFNDESVPFGNGEIVILLEKEHSLLMIHEEKVAALGYEPVGFSTLAQLLEWLTKSDQQPDLAIIDVASLEESVRLVDLERSLAGLSLLLVKDQYRTGSMSEHNLRRLGALRKPLNSRSLAHAIHQKMAAGDNAQPDQLQATGRYAGKLG